MRISDWSSDVCSSDLRWVGGGSSLDCARRRMTSIDFGGAQIWPVLGPPLRKQRLRLGVLDRWRDDDVLALLPIGRGGDALGVAELERIDHAIGRASCRERVCQYV